MTHHDAQHLVFEIAKLGYRFSDWEKGLIASIETRIKKGINLTSGQSRSLQDIYRKAAGDGERVARQYVR